MSRARTLLATAAAVAVGAGIAGCGGGGDESEASSSETVPTTVPEPTTTTAVPPSAALRPPPCPVGAANCERAAGEIAFVERVDADGDGDAHFVLISAESITAPGVSVIDVRADLRPSPLPGVGDQLAASGPVYEGSLGQRQIQADAIRFRRTGG